MYKAKNGTTFQKDGEGINVLIGHVDKSESLVVSQDDLTEWFLEFYVRRMMARKIDNMTTEELRKGIISFVNLGM